MPQYYYHKYIEDPQKNMVIYSNENIVVVFRHIKKCLSFMTLFIGIRW